jgi:molybdopterin/thiamine biosynthesis adenylyltransferase
LKNISLQTLKNSCIRGDKRTEKKETIMSTPFERYQCQIALPGFGVASQELLENARILIVGMGGLGCPSAQYLASSGVGTIGIADDDTVSLSNRIARSYIPPTM